MEGTPSDGWCPPVTFRPVTPQHVPSRSAVWSALLGAGRSGRLAGPRVTSTGPPGPMTGGGPPGFYSPLTVTGTLEPYGGEVLVVPLPNWP